jgi:hypothetical protein
MGRVCKTPRTFRVDTTLMCGRFDPGERYTGVNWTEAERHVQSAPEDASPDWLLSHRTRRRIILFLNTTAFTLTLLISNVSYTSCVVVCIKYKLIIHQLYSTFQFPISKFKFIFDAI